MAAEILACYHTITPIQDDLDNRIRESVQIAEHNPALAQYSFPSLKISGNPSPTSYIVHSLKPFRIL